MSQSNPDVLMVETVDDFASLIAAWHHNRISQLQMAISAPDDVEIQFSLAEGEPEVTMNADNLAGFRAGLALALNLFGKLPFDAIPVEPTEVVEPEVPANE